MKLDTLIEIPGNLILSYNDERRQPFVEKALIDELWNEFLQKKPDAYNGTQLLVPEIEIQYDGQDLMMPTYDGKYSWLIYILNNPKIPRDKWWLAIAPKPIPITTDGYMVFGLQAQHTTHGGKILAIGGGLDSRDIIDGRPNLQACMSREVKEETGLIYGENYFDFQVLGVYLFSHNPSIILPHMTKLTLDREQTQDLFDAHNAGLIAVGKKPELESIVFVQSTKDFPEGAEVYPYIPPAIKKIQELII